MPAMSVSTFVDFLRTRNILPSGQIEQLAADPETENAEPPTVAEMLVRRGWLTRYQADQLLQAEGQNLVVGPYILLEPLGEGGMGQVFKARHRVLDRIVAIKLIREERISTDPEAIRRFQREARAAALLSHPNIVLIYDADCSGSTYFIAMEYIDGTDLARLVKEQGPLAVAQACDYIRQAACGLAHAHEKGMVHRDIKPSNLLASGLVLKRAEQPPTAPVPGSGLATKLVRRPVRPSPGRLDRNDPSNPPVIKILDMGLARVVQGNDSQSSASLTKEGSIVGTPDFIAPEQARDAHRVDIRADLYSLGCTFFYLLTGQPPFPTGSTIEKLLMHQLDDPPEVDRLRKDVPPEVALLVRKLMAKSPGQRYQTPGELLAALAASRAIPSVAPSPAPEAGGDSKATRTISRTVDERGVRPEPESSETVNRAPGPHRLGADTMSEKAHSARLLATLTGHCGAVLSLAFSADRDRLASGGQDATTRLWDFSDGKPRELAVMYKHIGAVRSLAFSNDGKLLASGAGTHDGLIWVREVAGQPREVLACQGHQGPVNALAFSPDSTVLASAGDDLVLRLWDVARYKPRPRATFNGHSLPIRAVAFTPDGKRVASASADKTVRLWDARQSSTPEQAVFTHPCAVNSLTISPDGELLVTGGEDHKVRVWGMSSLANPQLLGELAHHDSPVRLVVIPQHGERLTAVGEDRVVVWNEEGELIEEWRVPKLTQPVFAMTGDGRYLGQGGADGDVHIYRVATKRPQPSQR